MARSKEQIIADMQTEYEGVDPSIDARKGPVYDHFIAPQSALGADLEARQDRTDRLASGDFAAVATEDELNLMAGTVGAGAPQGETSKGYAYFGTRSRPRSTDIIPIPVGSLCADESQTYVYQTTEAASIDGRYPDNYYNPTKRTYEIRVAIEAVAVGGDYDLPPYRIRKTLTSIAGIDFVENRERTKGGIDPGGSETTQARAEASLIGQELGSPNGMASAILEAHEGAESIEIVTSQDYDLFRRPTTKPGLDIYYSGEEVDTVTEEYTAVGGELSWVPAQKPVQEILSVTINGLAADYEWVVDTARATRFSTEDASQIEFASALTAGQTLQVKYKVDTLAAAIAEDYTGDEGIFKTDVLVRRSIRPAPIVTIYAEADTGFNPFSLKTDLLAEVKAFFETGEFGATYYPKDCRDQLGAEVIGLRKKPVIAVFQLDGRALNDVEPIELKRNETIEVDEDLIEINVS